MGDHPTGYVIFTPEGRLSFMLSAEGQRMVVKAGFDPLDAATAEHQLGSLLED